jgi:hypothetical protein
MAFLSNHPLKGPHNSRCLLTPQVPTHGDDKPGLLPERKKYSKKIIPLLIWLTISKYWL